MSPAMGSGGQRGSRLRRKSSSCTDKGGTAAAAVWLALLALLAAPASALRVMRLLHTWGTVDFQFESPAQRQQLLRSGRFQPGNSVPFDVDFHLATGRVFVSLPAMLPGSPVTLATVAQRRQQAPLLAPFPDWRWHAGGGGCDGLTSVFRIFVDQCGRLWVVDSGRADIATARPHQRCPPQLLVFDAASRRLLRRHRFPKPEASWLPLTVVVELPGDDCGNAFAYVADAGAFQLLVYSLRRDRSWAVRSALFFPDVNRRSFDVFGTAFELMDGVMGLSLSPRLRDPDGRLLLFHAFSSAQQGVVRTAVLRNASLFAAGGNAAPRDFRFIGERGSQAAPAAMSLDGIQFFSEVAGNTISCWNYKFPFNRVFMGAVETDPKVIRFVTGVKTVQTGSGEEVWALANNAQLLLAGSYRANVTGSVNIISGRKDALVAGTVCC